MTTSTHPRPPDGTDPTDVGDLSIGDLAGLTGVGVATLRVWESRHGFPIPHRRDSGHRRYDQEHVTLVRDVQRRRGEGVRLDAAISQTLDAHARPTPSGARASDSIYATLRHSSPGLVPQRLTKTTLLALSWAIEDELASRAERGHLFGAFQRAANFHSAQPRWDDLSRTMLSTLVFADFAPDDQQSVHQGSPAMVSLPDEHPMRREWALVSSSADLPIALAAREVPGQSGTRDRDRVFESVWTVEHDAVRRAAQVCATVAADRGLDGAEDLVGEMDRPVEATPLDLAQVVSLFNRIVAYVGDQ